MTDAARNIAGLTFNQLKERFEGLRESLRTIESGQVAMSPEVYDQYHSIPGEIRETLKKIGVVKEMIAILEGIVGNAQLDPTVADELEAEMPGDISFELWIDALKTTIERHDGAFETVKSEVMDLISNILRITEDIQWDDDQALERIDSELSTDVKAFEGKGQQAEEILSRNIELMTRLLQVVEVANAAGLQMPDIPRSFLKEMSTVSSELAEEPGVQSAFETEVQTELGIFLAQYPKGIAMSKIFTEGGLILQRGKRKDYITISSQTLLDEMAQKVGLTKEEGDIEEKIFAETGYTKRTLTVKGLTKVLSYIDPETNERGFRLNTKKFGIEES